MGWFKRKPKYTIVTDGMSWALKRRDGKFLDLVSHEFWWGKESKFFNDCWRSDKQLVETLMSRLKS